MGSPAGLSGSPAAQDLASVVLVAMARLLTGLYRWAADPTGLLAGSQAQGHRHRVTGTGSLAGRWLYTGAGRARHALHLGGRRFTAGDRLYTQQGVCVARLVSGSTSGGACEGVKVWPFCSGTHLPSPQTCGPASQGCARRDISAVPPHGWPASGLRHVGSGTLRQARRAGIARRGSVRTPAFTISGAPCGGQR